MAYKVHNMEQRGNKQNSKLIHANQKMKIESETIRASKGRLVGKRIGALLKEGRGRFYILRRCVIMLICS